jgi:transcriptional regulator with XRE-family HTH domain
MINIAKRIKELRIKKDLTQAQVAESVGLARASYISVEQGKRDLSLQEVEKLAHMLGVSLGELVYSEGVGYEKYEQMLFVFLRSVSSKKKLTKTKLAKLLYLADFAWFYENHKSMSGMQYRKIQYGPVPDYYFTLIQELHDTGKISVKEMSRGAQIIEEDRVGERVGSELLNPEEKKFIKKIAKRWDNKNTKEIVDFTHAQLPYEFADKGEIIPYELITQEEPNHVY